MKFLFQVMANNKWLMINKDSNDENVDINALILSFMNIISNPCLPDHVVIMLIQNISVTLFSSFKHELHSS